MSDRVRDTLTALRVDADATPLAAADQVRRRGQARTRHQAVAGLAVVVVAVGVVLGGGSLFGGGDPRHDPNTVATNGPTPKALTLAVDPLLRADDVTGRALPSDHYLPEEAPGEVAAELGEFFG